MDVLMVVRVGDRLIGPLLDTVKFVSDGLPVLVHTSADAELALRSAQRDLVILDPDIATIDMLADDSDWRPIVVGWLPAGSPGRLAQLLDAGADDVLDPSMPPQVLAARLRRALRGRPVALGPRPASIGALQVDARLRLATWQGGVLALTPREAEVLQVLVAAVGRPVARETIYRQVWRWAMPRGDRTVDVNVKRLRGKLSEAGVPVEIVTQPGVGYRVRVDSDDPVVTGL